MLGLGSIGGLVQARRFWAEPTVHGVPAVADLVPMCADRCAREGMSKHHKTLDAP